MTISTPGRTGTSLTSAGRYLMTPSIIERDIRGYHLREDPTLVAQVRAIKRSSRYYADEGFRVARRGVGA